MTIVSPIICRSHGSLSVHSARSETNLLYKSDPTTTSPTITCEVEVEGKGNSPKASLQWRHYERNGVSNHQRLNCLLNLLSRRRSKKTSKLRVTGLCVGNSPVTGEFPAQRASSAENVSIWWRHHVLSKCMSWSQMWLVDPNDNLFSLIPRYNPQHSELLQFNSKVQRVFHNAMQQW